MRGEQCSVARCVVLPYMESNVEACSSPLHHSTIPSFHSTKSRDTNAPYECAQVCYRWSTPFTMQHKLWILTQGCNRLLLVHVISLPSRDRLCLCSVVTFNTIQYKGTTQLQPITMACAAFSAGPDCTNGEVEPFKPYGGKSMLNSTLRCKI